MTGFFFYGTLCHAPLRRAVLGGDPAVMPARMPDCHVAPVADGSFLVLVDGGDGVDGVYLSDLPDEDVARLDFYESSYGYHSVERPADLADGRRVVAQVYVPRVPLALADGDWDIEAWAARWLGTAAATARDLMGLYGQHPADMARRRLPQMIVRAASTVRAGQGGGRQTLRRAPAADDVERHALHHPYNGYFAVEEHDLRFRRFDGALSPVVNRAIFISGDAAVLLPYDPVRDRVMVIEQFRAGPYGRGDPNPWLIEAIAGRIDGGETPQDTVRREAIEEAGLTLHRILAGPSYYPSPAAKAEYIYSFVGLADLPDTAAGLGGLASEAEDIRSHVIPFTRLEELADSGEIDNAPLLLLVAWLGRIRADLRAETQGNGAPKP